MNNEIVRKVGALHDMRIEDKHIRAVLSGEETILPADVIETIINETHRHAKSILDLLRELLVDLRSNPAVFIGGGSILLKRSLKIHLLLLRLILLHQLMQTHWDIKCWRLRHCVPESDMVRKCEERWEISFFTTICGRDR